MAIQIGAILKKRREWARLTQQELIEHTGLDRSSSYIGALERGKTSPTLEELEHLARYFRTDVVEMIEEARGSAERRTQESVAPETPSEMDRLWAALSEDDRDLLLQFGELLLRRRKRG